MAYVNVPNDLSKIKNKIAFGLTKRQLICFGAGGLVGIPLYLLTRKHIGNTAALFLMLIIMLPAFLMAMYERDGQPLEKVLRNIIRTTFQRSGGRPYRTENIYAPFVGKEESFAKIQEQKPRQDAKRKAKQKPQEKTKQQRKRRKMAKHKGKHER